MKVYVVMLHCGAENTTSFYTEAESVPACYNTREAAEAVAVSARHTYNNDNDDGYDWEVYVVELPVV
jgi:hypothetical protein